MAFVLSRLSYYAAGVTFDARPLQFYVQLIDPELLRTRLLESVFHLHTQPPGFNLLIGCFLKIFGEMHVLAFQVFYLFLGLSIAWMTFRLMTRLGANPNIAAVLAILFSVSPASILYENLLTYEYPIVALMTAAALSLIEWIRTRRGAWLAAFQGSLLALMLIRGTYQPVYYLLIIAALWLAFRPDGRRIALSAAIPLAVVLGLSLKNWMLFGAFNTGSWPGFQAAIMTTYQLSEAQRTRLQQQGLLSPLASVPPIMPFARYQPYVTLPAKRGIPVLDEPVKSTGEVNPNHLAFRQVQQRHLEDAKTVLRHHPEALAKALATAWFTYFLPATDFPFFDRNRPKIAALDRAFNLILHGQWNDTGDRGQLRAILAAGSPASLLLYTGLFLMIGLPGLVLWAGWRVVSGLRSGWLSLGRGFTIGFLVFNIAFVTAVSNLASCYENNRYRFSLDTFYLTLFGLFLTWVQARAALAQSPQRDSQPRPRSAAAHRLATALQWHRSAFHAPVQNADGTDLSPQTPRRPSLHEAR